MFFYPALFLPRGMKNETGGKDIRPRAGLEPIQPAVELNSNTASVFSSRSKACLACNHVDGLEREEKHWRDEKHIWHPAGPEPIMMTLL